MPPDGQAVGETVSRFSLHVVPHAQGYWGLVRVVGCYDAWEAGKDAAWHWREKFIVANDTHAANRYERTALYRGERCEPSEQQPNAPVPRGAVSEQRGDEDVFTAKVRCDEPAGCMVMLRVSYHPLFVVTAADGTRLPTVALAPSYLGFRVPQGTARYTARYTVPLWSTLLFVACYAWLLGALAVAVAWPTVHTILPAVSQMLKDE